MDELLEQFLLEGRDLVAQASADFVALGQRADDAVAIDSAFRAIHTLKGSVAIFALHPAERILHAAEDLLERAKKSGAAIEPDALAALVACIDRIDHWIDDIERDGSLPEDAASVSDRLVAAFLTHSRDTMPSSPASAAPASPDESAWTMALLERQEAAHDGARALAAFRYTPDPDCFFRGEDPLAIAMAVPEILVLSVRPAGGAWPAHDAIEPFACTSILEGLSAADVETVRGALRLVHDQATVTAVDTRRDSGAALPERDGKSADMLRVSAARVDALADGLGELIVAVNAMAGLAETANGVDRVLAANVRAVQAGLEKVTGRLHRDVSAVRAVSLESALRRLPRLVREIAESLGKQVRLTIEGEELEVDKQIADAMFEPLLHLLRNAIDHGAEPPEQRLASGKVVECLISLRFKRAGDSVMAILSDDGRGIDPARIREVAVERGLRNRDEAEALSDAAALRLIFVPGFSTAETVTSVSGRGVGMDAVQAVIERLRGTIDVESALGAGTTFRMRLPVSALTTRLLVVEAGSGRYGIALDQILETVRIENDALKAVGSGQACVLRGRTVPVVSLGALLGDDAPDHPVARMLVTQAAGDRVAVRVDRFSERLDAFVRPSAGLLASVPGVTGSTLMGDGSVLLVLDLPELLA